MGKRKSRKRKGWFFLLPAVIVGICAGLFYTRLYEEIDRELFGLLDYLRPPVEAEQKILQVTIEWPYPDREYLGKGIMALHELGADVSVLAADMEELPAGTGNTYVPFFVEDTDEAQLPGIQAAAAELFSLREAEVRGLFPHRLEAVRFPSFPLLSGARGGGFLYPDNSAVLDGQKLPLIRMYRDKYYPHLLFAAVLGWMQQPAVFLFSDRVVLQNAAVPGSEMKNIVIPFSESGDIYVRGPKPELVSFTPFIRQEEMIEELYLLVDRMEEKGLFNEETGGKKLTEIYESAESVRLDLIAGQAEGAEQNLRALRERFIREANAFFFGDAETLVRDQLEAEAEKAEVEKLFAGGRSLSRQITDKREELSSTVSGAFCILTYERIPEAAVQKYTAAVHTLLTQNFVDDVPWWYSLAAAAVLAFLLMFVLTRFRPVLAAVIGLPAAAVFAGLPLAGFYFFSMYLPLFFPAAASAAVYIAALIVQITTFTREKRDIRVRFFNSVPDVRMGDVTDMYSSGGGAGGIKLPMSVLHVRIGNQASIIREHSPEEVMHVYTLFSKIVRQEILTYEGLVGNVGAGTAWGVWGAFSEDTSEALVACKAALGLQNRLQQEDLPFTLICSLTAGEGIRGKTVTLADTAVPITGIPVLQGEKILQAHAMFGSPIIVSGKIHNETGNTYLFRRLDRIRIEGFTEAVRLYELFGPPETVDENLRQFLDCYSRAHGLFEKQEWKQAHKMFIEALQIVEQDKPSTLYARRCQKFVKEPPSASWDGTFSLL